jgi:septum formation protein
MLFIGIAAPIACQGRKPDRMKNLLLASQSPRRRELLALLGLPFKVTSPNVAEAPQTDEPPIKLVVRLSLAKARAACSLSPSIDPDTIYTGERNQVVTLAKRQEPGFKQAIDCCCCAAAVVIACDTLVALDGEPLGKPRDAAEATSMLRRLRGRSHTVYSAVALLEPTTGRASTDVAETQVGMRAYTDAEIAAYVASGDPLDKAGAYAIQHPGFHPAVCGELQGCYANVMGLPLCHLTRCLRAWGVEPLRDVPAACQARTGHDCATYTIILNDQ